VFERRQHVLRTNNCWDDSNLQLLAEEVGRTKVVAAYRQAADDAAQHLGLRLRYVLFSDP
jgi:hypothetical protein